MVASEEPVFWLVDDSESDHMLFRHAFTEIRSSLELRSMHSAEDALASLDDGYSPSLVLLDLNMPGLGGFHFLQTRQARGHHHFPVVVVSSSAADEDIRRSYELGANCYIVKPFNYDELNSFAEGLLHFWLGLAKLPSGC